MGDEPTNSGFDINPEYIDDRNQEFYRSAEEREDEEETKRLIEDQNIQEEKQALAEQADPRDAEKWGF